MVFILGNSSRCADVDVDVLLESGLKLSDIIVILCSKLLDYILLKSGSRY